MTNRMFSTLQLSKPKIGWIIVQKGERNGLYPMENVLAWTKKGAIARFSELMGMSWAELQLGDGFDCIRVRIESAP